MTCTLFDEIACDVLCILGQEGCYKCYRGINAGLWCDCIEIKFF